MAGLTIEERVAAGVAWLDENKPGWESLIDLGTLRLAACTRCVLGQVFRGDAEAFEADMDGFSYVLTMLIEDRISPAVLGFDTWDEFDDGAGGAGPDSYPLLEREWRQVLLQRHSNATGGLDNGWTNN